ncbi:MAG: DEAD/DEAH box helicase, partial [Myxococcota bacterium]
MPEPPWRHRRGLPSVLASWQDKASIQRCVTAQRVIEAQPPARVDVPPDLFSGLTEALRKKGIDGLYRHQREAIDAARQGRHVVIATPTASGKSLCFQLPVLDAMARDPSSTAIYVYPTKALSRDQEQAVQAFVRDSALPVGAVVYDGDTPGDARRSARQRAQLIMSNPDMLHASILPQHASWARIFQNLKYVVLDEVHTYRGVFGSHVANVISRLKRV